MSVFILFGSEVVPWALSKTEAPEMVWLALFLTITTAIVSSFFLQPITVIKEKRN